METIQQKIAVLACSGASNTGANLPLALLENDVLFLDQLTDGGA